MSDNTIGMDGQAGRSWRLSPDRHPGRPAAPGAGDGRGARLATLTVRQASSAPGAPGAWQRFLLAHARWILLVTVVAVAAGAAVAFSQTPAYISQANVLVEPPSSVASAPQTTYMATEKSIASSGAVLSRAAKSLHVPEQQLLGGLSVSVPSSTYLLQISYSSPDPAIAQQRAQAIANAYVAYRSGVSSPGSTSGSGSVPGAGTTPGAGTSGESTAPSATIVTPAPLPASPSSPSYPLDIGVAVLAGLCLGIGTAGLRDHLDDRVRGSLDLEAQAGAPVLALIPAPEPAPGALRTADATAPLVMVTGPGSVTADAYRGLRTRLVQAASARGAKTLLVTSPAWEDKGWVAANLATALAQSGVDTVLVCADLRWGRAHQVLEPRGGGTDGTAGAAGLSGLLDWRVRLPGALLSTRVPGLRLLPPGPLPADPSAVLQRPVLRTVLDEITSIADFVIIESPPLLASPDTGLLAELAELVLLVADTRKTARAQVRAAVRELGQAGGTLAGCALGTAGEPGGPAGPGSPSTVPADSPARAPRHGMQDQDPAGLPPAAAAGDTYGEAAEQSGAVRITPGPSRPAGHAERAAASRTTWTTEEDRTR